MKKHRTAEFGQAFTEFVICLVPFLFLFTGILVVAIVGHDHVRGAIEARAKVDADSADGITMGGIKAADKSAHGAGYTAEGAFDTEKYMASLVDENNTDYKTQLRVSAMKLYDLKEGKYVSHDYSAMNFLDAAALNGAAVDRGDPLVRYNMSYLSTLAKVYLGLTMESSDTAFMPSRVE